MKWKAILGSLGGRFLGAVLLVAAGAKAVDPGTFAEQIQLEGLDFLLSTRTVLLIALAVETGLGMALIMGVRRLWVLGPTALLVSFFLFLNGRNYWLVLHGLRDESASCGCFGSLLNRTPAEAFWQDLLLLVPPLLLAFGGRQSERRFLTRLRLLLAGITAVAVMMYAGANPDLQFVEIAAAVAGQSSQERFVRTSDYRLIIDSREAAEAEIYHSDESVTFLVLSSRLSSPVLLRLRTSAVETVAQAKISRGGDGSITLLPDPVFRPQGEFELTAEGISFTVEGHELLLKSSQ
ncbi:MAG: MauE/DoxX family redox-associated membrane protein [Acidobacteriota bacterium]